MKRGCIVFVFVTAACGTRSQSDSWEGSVRDSAGVTVVENTGGGVWGETPQWSLEHVRTIPDETIGRITAIARLADGRLYAMDQMAASVHVYDGAGAPAGTFGRPGGGPGELGRGAGIVLAHNDTIIVPDPGNQRISLFSPAGQLLREIPLSLADGFPMGFRIAGRSGVVFQRRSVSGGAAGDAIVALALADGATDTITTLPRGLAFDMTGGAMSVVFFAPEPSWDVRDDDVILIADDGRFELQIRGFDGQVHRIVRRTFIPRPVTDDDQLALREQLRSTMSRTGAPPDRVEQFLQRVSFAESYPAFQSASFGPQGSIWVQEFRSFSELSEEERAAFGPGGADGGSARWHVFGSDGRYLGLMTMPDRFRPLLFDGDLIAGVVTDENDAESIALYRVRTS